LKTKNLGFRNLVFKKPNGQFLVVFFTLFMAVKVAFLGLVLKHFDQQFVGPLQRTKQSA